MRVQGDARRVAVLIVAAVVMGGLVVGILQTSHDQFRLLAPASGTVDANGAIWGVQAAADQQYTSEIVQNQVVSESTTTEIATMTLSSTTSPGESKSPGSVLNSSGLATSTAGGGSIEYFANVTLAASNPEEAASRVSAVAYSDGGYVAYSSTNANFSLIVVRVPEADYQDALVKIEAVGNLTSLNENSNDVTVQYTDLNATLQSLQTEESALLRLLNDSASVNNTLAIESQLQAINYQIDSTEAQILETQRLISYSTISASIYIPQKSIKTAPLTLRLTATPVSGESPLGVTFSALVQGGTAPYVINYNFGDGSSEQGQIIIHQYYSSGTFNASVTVTDADGDVAQSWAVIHVSSPPATLGSETFVTSVENLFVNVLEGVVEVAVVVVPIGILAAVVLLPLGRKLRPRREPRQS
ncbi:MAG TPA: DUF4349 domain-containing protein [Nitrososphaerales archaeon]|nr:DUF4349 domain-containing protein [Nitrososphaerales archaeon]